MCLFVHNQQLFCLRVSNSRIIKNSWIIYYVTHITKTWYVHTFLYLNMFQSESLNMSQNLCQPEHLTEHADGHVHKHLPARKPEQAHEHVPEHVACIIDLPN